MRSWESRSAEHANLLNPAFVGVVCWNAVKEYRRTINAEVPYPVPFIVTPLVLHKKTRSSLPSSIRTTFTSWVSSPEGTQAKIDFAARATSLVPVVKETILFSIAHELISITTDGFFNIGAKSVQSSVIKSQGFSDEVIACINSAAFCGRWLARSGKIETIMALLGVKP